MAVTETVVVGVPEATAAGEARRAPRDFAARLGFDEVQAGKVAIVATEAATNLARHAGGGEMILGALQADGVAGIEMLALDRGPGIADLVRSLGDGFSTAGSAGTGLGAIRRLASEFDIYSSPGLGTAVLARLWAGGRPTARGRGLEVAGVSAAKPGEDVCGDAWALDQAGGAQVAMLVADGLGHGRPAAEAAAEAVRMFRASPDTRPAARLDRIHGALRSTRGAAIAVAEVDVAARVVRFAGVGNVCGTIFGSDRSRSFVSHNGTVGHEVRRVQEFSYPWPDGGLLVMHTDGLATHWKLDAYAGLAARHPALIAGVLYRDFKRGRDDVTVVVARDAAP